MIICARRALAEYVGTFSMVLMGTGSIILADSNPLMFGAGTVAASFGFAVAGMILLFGKVSGSHINPAVTIALWHGKLFSRNEVIPYLFSQCLGALSASLLLKILAPTHHSLGATLPSMSLGTTFLLELLLTFILIMVIFGFYTASPRLKKVAPCAIGTAVGLEAFFAGPFTGASMNPARSLGPALLSSNTTGLWIYLLAPAIGALLATRLYLFLRPYLDKNSSGQIVRTDLEVIND